jgi:hypothetical protein
MSFRNAVIGGRKMTLRSEATDLRGPRDVRFSPVSDRGAASHYVTRRAISDQSAAQQNWVLFDHLVGERQLAG